MNHDELIRYFNSIIPCRMEDILKKRAQEGDEKAAQVLAIIKAGAKESTMKTGIELIAAERARHANMWGDEHDNGHYCGEMACAAAVYATPPMQRTDNDIDSQLWPDGWQQNDYERICELTVAGALIAAEIDRLQRRKAKGK